MKASCDVRSCIRLEEIRVTRKVTVPHQVWFELNPKIIADLEKIQQQNMVLPLEPESLMDLRYYALVNSGLLTLTENLNPSSRIVIFTSNYSFSSERLPITVIRSRIDLSGKVSQEIQQQLWQQPELFWQIVNIHYWLVEQILQQLPLSHTPYLTYLIWGLWMAIASILGLVIWYCLSLAFWVKVGIAIIIGFYLKKILNYLFTTKLKNWAIHKLVYSFDNYKSHRRKIALWLMQQ